MHCKTKIVSILKSRSGASLLFVLGVMLMLLAVGASVLAAAFGNVGINIRQERHNRAILLSESIHRNIRYSLEAYDSDFEESLSGRLAHQILLSDGELDDIELDIEILGFSGGLDAVQSVVLSFPFAEARIFEAVEGDLDLDIPDVPRTAQLSARMVVTVVIEVDSYLNERRIITSEAVYEYSGGVMIGYPELDDISGDIINYDMFFNDYNDHGEWEILSFRTIES